MTKKNGYNVVSLFSGCGGLDIGISNAGTNEFNTNGSESEFNFIWSNDALEHACKSLSMNFDKAFENDIDELGDKKVVYHGDVREVDFTESVPNSDSIDLVVGGFPCQDFSILRGDDNRGGVEVERGKLYLEFARSLATLQPKMFVAENVKGLVSANNGKAYEQILDDFQNLDRN
jgi:DNA (cytosine-5)-methyltransferase 1